MNRLWKFLSSLHLPVHQRMREIPPPDPELYQHSYKRESIQVVNLDRFEENRANPMVYVPKDDTQSD